MKTIRCIIKDHKYVPYGEDDTKNYKPIKGEVIRLIDGQTGETLDIIEAIRLSACRSCCLNTKEGCMNGVFICPMCLQFQSINNMMEEI